MIIWMKSQNAEISRRQHNGQLHAESRKHCSLTLLPKDGVNLRHLPNYRERVHECNRQTVTDR